jgi:hypothetical protein
MDEFHYYLTKRTTLTISTDISIDEMRQAIANSMGIDVSKVPEFDLTKELAEIRKQSDRVNEIIKGYKELLLTITKSTKDKYEELHDIGKFILASGDTLTIQIPEVIFDFPDFILINEDQERIGVEHTRLMNEEMKAIIKTVKYFISEANKLLEVELNHINKTVNIFVDLNQKVIGECTFKNKRFTASQKTEVSKIIATYIKSELIGGNIPRPDFITHIEITPNKDDRIDLLLGEEYFTRNDFEEQLITRIERKEPRANAYRCATKFDQLWLI